MRLDRASVQTISLTRGYVAIVDDEDYEQVSGRKWYAQVATHTVYAVRDNWARGVKTAVSMHRVIVGAKPGEQVDHVNHDGLDNRRSNLRLCVGFQNQGNRRKQQGTSSQFKGVYWNKRAGKWHTQIRFRGQQRHLGLFADEVEAAKAYDKAALAQWGEFACINFPPVVIS